MNKHQIDDTIDMLAKSQGFYGRLQRELAEADEAKREDFYSRFAGCSDPVDFILALES